MTKKNFEERVMFYQILEKQRSCKFILSLSWALGLEPALCESFWRSEWLSCHLSDIPRKGIKGSLPSPKHSRLYA